MFELQWYHIFLTLEICHIAIIVDLWIMVILRSKWLVYHDICVFFVFWFHGSCNPCNLGLWVSEICIRDLCQSFFLFSWFDGSCNLVFFLQMQMYRCCSFRLICALPWWPVLKNKGMVRRTSTMGWLYPDEKFVLTTAHRSTIECIFIYP